MYDEHASGPEHGPVELGLGEVDLLLGISCTVHFHKLNWLVKLHFTCVDKCQKLNSNKIAVSSLRESLVFI